MFNWSKINHRSAFGKALRLPLKLLPKALVLPILSGPMKGMKWRVGTSDHGCWLGTFELTKQQAIWNQVRPDMVVYDIGANAGIYTLLFAKAVGHNGRVFAFEPFAENVTNFLCHTRLNHLENVVLIQAALSSGLGLSSFKAGATNSMGALTGDATPLQVPTFSMDELVSTYGFPSPDFVKMDVEGAESEVLAGASTILKEQSAVWFIALHGDEQKQNCQEILEAHHYRLFTLDARPVTYRLETSTHDEIYAVPAHHRNVA
ncbi:MAG: FkbM family methyltransferase [Pyrinomonadaceae bacterium]